MGKAIEAAEARRRKAAKKQAEHEKEVWRKIRVPVMIAAAVVVIAVIALVVVNRVNVNRNLVSVSNGEMTGLGEDWIVVNTGTTASPACYHLASFTPPAGYTLDPEYAISTTKLQQDRYYRADDAANPVQSIYVVGVANKSAADMVEYLSSTSYFTVDRYETTTIGGRSVTWIAATMPAYDESGNVIDGRSSRMLYAYVDTDHSSTVGVCLSGREYATGELPDSQVYLDQLEGVLSGLTLMN